jgi:hypothetical protein
MLHQVWHFDRVQENNPHDVDEEHEGQS